MLLAKAVGVGSTAIAATSIGTVTADPSTNPVMFDVPGLGWIPVVPMAIGALAALLVRVVIITSSPHALRSYNVALTLLAMLGAASWISEHQAGPGTSFWIGSGFGAAGVGLIEFSRRFFPMAKQDKRDDR
jgi:hypothetical protein